MQAGRMRERLTVTRKVVTNDGGTPVPAAPAVIQPRVAAEIRTASEARLERVFASQVQAVATHVVRIRAGLSWTVKHDDVLVWHDGLTGDRSLNVVGVADPDGRRTELVIAVTERRA
jgi:head-tail adaptor